MYVNLKILNQHPKLLEVLRRRSTFPRPSINLSGPDEGSTGSRLVMDGSGTRGIG